MNKLVNILMTNSDLPLLFTFKDFEKIGYKKYEFEKELKEGLEKKYIDRVYGDIYMLDVKHHNRFVPTRALSQMIMPNSYVSMYYVLCDYNWIPEMVFSITSVTTGKDCTIDTDGYGTFMYHHLYDKLPTTGICIEEDFEGTYRIAKPLRALCDLLYFTDKEWPWSIDNLYEVFRISKKFSLEEDLNSADFDELQGTIGIESIENLLQDIRKELAL